MANRLVASVFAGALVAGTAFAASAQTPAPAPMPAPAAPATTAKPAAAPKAMKQSDAAHPMHRQMGASRTTAGDAEVERLNQLSLDMAKKNINTGDQPLTLPKEGTTHS
ncbi:hypothetical protein [Limobrevibacterium gyesilva]|uniref:Uncharacterized protein n=1 Tax=Limobrevibacterium gyesilva TaxID=2991712 RepID=A0AA42CD01_9PROT|nr:hypothetical protein [Limobrevibacterium gyesilva]MCW3474243.1 hypothetical protein [Limobrevibacterium gyesilva]